MDPEIKITGEKVPSEDYVQDKKIQKMRKIAAFVLAQIYLLGICAAAAWQLLIDSLTVYLYWKWFLLNAFQNIPEINFYQAVVIQLMMYVLIPVVIPPVYKNEFIKRNIEGNKTLFNRIATPTFKIIVGWLIYKLFI